MIFDEWFDRVVIISLPRDRERADGALSDLRAKHLSERAVVVPGIDGRICPKSDWWQAGNGSWGCMNSHYRVVQDALMDGVEKLLVIEDDCIWQPRAAAMATAIREVLPADWGQLYLGGQHRPEYPPSRIEGTPALLRAASIHRTHAYAIHARAMGRFLKHIIYAPDYTSGKKDKGIRMHVDHQLERAHRRGDWPVYCPSFWLAGQGENHSIIRNVDEPERWWHFPFQESWRRMPLVIWDAESADERIRHLHFGRHIEPGDPVVDTGVRDSRNAGDAVRFMEMIAEQAYADQRLPAVATACGPEKIDWLTSKWLGPVLRISENPDLPSICDFPTSKVVRHPWFNPSSAPVPAAAVEPEPEEV